MTECSLYISGFVINNLNLFFLIQDGRSSSSAESRSLTNDGEEKKTHDELFPIVIAAEPRRDPKEHAYSVYGSPSIDYSKLYSLPGMLNKHF
jgi:hypothetical protein